MTMDIELTVAVMIMMACFRLLSGWFDIFS